MSAHIEQITESALQIMAKRASKLEPGRLFEITADDIVATVVADPVGETAFYLAKLIVCGIEHYNLFRAAGAA